MPKLKTRKAFEARVTITPKGKVMRRKSGQSHFNAKERGKTTRMKRRDISMSETLTKNIKQQIPYN